MGETQTQSRSLPRLKTHIKLAFTLGFALLLAVGTGQWSQAKVNKKLTITSLKQAFSLYGRRLKFVYEVAIPPKGREVKGTSHTVQGEFHFFSAGSYGLVMTFPPDRKGARVLVEPMGGKMFNPKSGNVEALKSGFRTAPLYGGPMTVDGLDALVGLGDKKTVWKEFKGMIEGRHPLWGAVQFFQPGPKDGGPWLILKRFKPQIGVISWGKVGGKDFPVETQWQLQDKRESGTGVLTLTDMGKTGLKAATFINGK